jgi:predicted DNA-binding transcriptional regulator AlpA
MRTSTPPKTHLIDKRTQQILDAAEGGDDEDLLTVAALAAWLGVSTEWLEIGRSKGYGPPFIRVGPNSIRYRRDDVRAWLAERRHLRTSEYESTSKGGPGRGRPRKQKRAKGGVS